MTAPRVGFAGTPEFAVPTLERLAASGVAVPWVLTQPDRPAGRGRKLAASPVKLAAERLGLKVEQPTSVRDPALAERLGPAPDLLVVIAYGLLLPRWLLDWPRRGCVNLHASLLPRWRGAAPIQYALLAGDPETGVTVMKMEDRLDAGPVYARHALTLTGEETAGTLHDRLAPLAADALQAALPGLLRGELAALPQDESSATYAPKIAKADAAIDWRAPAAVLARRVRAFNPWPVAEAELTSGQRLRIWFARALDAAAGAAPGRIVATSPAGIDVATGDGVLRIEQLQPPGGRPMPAAAYLAAHSLDGASFVA